MRNLSLFLAGIFSLIYTSGIGQVSSKNTPDSHIIVFKLKESDSKAASSLRQQAASISIASLPKNIKIHDFNQPFPYQNNVKNGNSVQRQGASSLQRIFKISLDNAQDATLVVEALASQANIEYAEILPEPVLLNKVADEKLNEQRYLETIKALQAWDIQQGSEDMLIGILDTGTELTHPDLKDNLYVNPNEIAGNGIDDDADGFVDNVHGWDFANNDNDPSADKNWHGVMVSGVASAVKGNGGIAGVAANCKFMPIKVFSSYNDRFIKGYEAIKYAADWGCKVINISWGATGGYSQYVQDIINYVVLEKDAVIVAAAGNTGEELDYYPASNEHVLSVSGSTYADHKAGWTSWSRFVDILGPCEGILSTKPDGQYTSGSGTSYTTPMVAGAAALVRLKYPELSALQVMELLRQSADNIQDIGDNKALDGYIGLGRLNILAAMEGIKKPSVRITNINCVSPWPGQLFRGDTVTLMLEATNYLASVNNLSLALASDNPYITILENSITLNELGTLEKTEEQALSFKILLHDDLPSSELLGFRINFNAEGYTDYQYFDLPTNFGYTDVQANELALTISENGNLGYNYDFNLLGNGLNYKGESIAKNLGLVVAGSAEAVTNNIIYQNSPAKRDQDFNTVKGLKVLQHNGEATQLISTFSTFTNEQTEDKLLIEQKITALNSVESNDGIILEYRVINQSAITKEHINLALFTDFNLNDGNANKATWNEELQFGYVYNASEDTYAATVLLTEQEPIFYAADLKSLNGNTTEFSKTISREDKWNFVSKGIGKTTAGSLGSGNDVALFSGGKIANLLPTEEVKVSLAFIAGTSLAEISQKARALKLIYQNELSTPSINSIVTLCEPQPQYNFSLNTAEKCRFYADAQGKELLGEGVGVDLVIEENKSIYLQRFNGLYFEALEQVDFRVETVEAAFELPQQEIELKQNTAFLQVVPAENSRSNVQQYAWKINNTLVSESAELNYTFSQAGEYTIELSVTNSEGCSNTISRTVSILPERFVEEALFYPNPVRNDLTVELPEIAIGQARVELVDLSGKMLFQFYNSSADKKLTLPLQDLKPGYYLVKITSPTKSWQAKIIKK